MAKADNINFKNDPKTKLKKKIIFSITLLLGSLILFIGGLAYIYSITPPRERNSIIDSINFLVKPGETAFKGRKTMNILCLGLDNNYTEKGIAYTKDSRSDTMFVISIDSSAKQINMLSIPRDTWVNIPGYGYEKINGAYAFGGLELAKKTVSSFLGVPIDHHVIIRIKAAKEIVDAIGGLEIDVMKDMDYDDNWGNLHIHLKKGPQKLDGAQAVGYARFRHDEEGDWGRMRRQQQVINAIIREMKKPGKFPKIDKLVGIVRENVETDLTTAEIIDICRLYKDFDRQNMMTGIIKGDDAVSDAGASIIIPNETEKKKLVKRLLIREGDELITNKKLAIYNGSQTQGLATELATYFESRGYEIVKIADADRYDYEDSAIISYTKNGLVNPDIKNILGYVTVQKGTDPPTNEDYTIIIGNKWVDWLRDHPMPEIERAIEEPPVYYPGVRYGSGSSSSGSSSTSDTPSDSGTEPAPENTDTSTEVHDTYIEEEPQTPLEVPTEQPTEHLPTEDVTHPEVDVTPEPVERYTVPIPPAPEKSKTESTNSTPEIPPEVDVD